MMRPALRAIAAAAARRRRPWWLGLVGEDEQDQTAEAAAAAGCIAFDYSTITDQCCTCFAQTVGTWDCLVDSWNAISGTTPGGAPAQLRYEDHTYTPIHASTEISNMSIAAGTRCGLWVGGNAWNDPGVLAADITDAGLVTLYQGGTIYDQYPYGAWVDGAALEIEAIAGSVFVWYDSALLFAYGLATPTGKVGLFNDDINAKQRLVIQDLRCG